jgi:hypothetical protein
VSYPYDILVGLKFKVLIGLVGVLGRVSVVMTGVFLMVHDSYYRFRILCSRGFVVLDFRGGWWMARSARHVELANPLPSPHGGVSLAEFRRGGKYLIEGGLMCRYKGKNYENSYVND